MQFKNLGVPFLTSFIIFIVQSNIYGANGSDATGSNENNSQPAILPGLGEFLVYINKQPITKYLGQIAITAIQFCIDPQLSQAIGDMSGYQQKHKPVSNFSLVRFAFKIFVKFFSLLTGKENGPDQIGTFFGFEPIEPDSSTMGYKRASEN